MGDVTAPVPADQISSQMPSASTPPDVPADETTKPSSRPMGGGVVNLRVSHDTLIKAGTHAELFTHGSCSIYDDLPALNERCTGSITGTVMLCKQDGQSAPKTDVVARATKVFDKGPGLGVLLKGNF